MNWDQILSCKRMRGTTRPNDIRNEFESDLGRIVFSPAVRRMHDKTQVFPLLTDDNIHTRLTHSLEVQNVSYSLGITICKNQEFIKRISNKFEPERTIPIILSSVGLAHDIGNPPFGHYGEDVIQAYFKKLFSSKVDIKLSDEEKLDFENFNGNAQGFRVLTRLQFLQDLYGLNLTLGTLSAFLKYPNLAEDMKLGKAKYQKELGVFQTEKDILEEIRNSTELINVRNPLTFLMEAADNICFQVMDIEDGYNKRYYTVDNIISYLCDNGDKTVKKYIEQFNERCLSLKDINYDNAKMVTLRIFLIQKLVNETSSIFLNNLQEIENGKFTKELTDSGKAGLSNTLYNFEKKYIFTNREIQTVELTGQSVLEGLLDHFVCDLIEYKIFDDEMKKEKKAILNKGRRLESVISKSIKEVVLLQEGKSNIQELSDYMKLRMIVDFISGMTDTFALDLYRKLQGTKL